ncbi:hypothetical protein SCHPADRAFT_865708 [Schizopora paradoxa]|uniref:Uncharacterized protein n=1 Tax=Schizopora paradoxa TaxID=27342 RepID=A0A0H2S4B0_9AGAM|nr:hypothetical protein SCHPADRAFT_865708 [Schizopora paradoxa]
MNSLAITSAPRFASKLKTFLPTELLDIVICDLLQTDYRFEVISGFASSCRAFRWIALRCFFMHLRVSLSERWRQIPHLTYMVKSVNLLATAEAITNPPVSLLSFHALHYVQVTFFRYSVIMQHQTIHAIIKSLPTTLAALVFEDLADIELGALAAIGARFPSLTRLELSCVERLDDSCCWSCFEESSSAVWHSPIPDIFSNTSNLTACICAALKPLTELQHLFLGFFLSPEYLLQEHFSHAPEFDEEGGVVLPFGPEWCTCCFENFATQVRADELQVSLSLAQHFKSLTSVGWGSFFSSKSSEIQERKTKIYVSRKNGRIRVRRRPWVIEPSRL